jgi:hypothetical protein
MRLSRLLVLTMILLAVSAGIASAADVCFEDAFGQVLIAKALTLPTANNCKAVNGFKKDSQLVFGGTVCRTWDNSYLVFSLQFGTVQFDPIDGGSIVFWLNPSTFEGFVRYLDWHIMDSPPGPAAYVGGFSSGQIGKVLCPAVRRFGLP